MQYNGGISNNYANHTGVTAMGEVIKRERLHIYLPNGYWQTSERYPVV